jgi:hypothetical protein
LRSAYVHNRVGEVPKTEFRVLLGNRTKEVRFERVGRQWLDVDGYTIMTDVGQKL